MLSLVLSLNYSDNRLRATPQGLVVCVDRTVWSGGRQLGEFGLASFTAVQLTKSQTLLLLQGLLHVDNLHQVVYTIGDASSDLLGWWTPAPMQGSVNLWSGNTAVHSYLVLAPSPPFNPLLARPPARGLPWRVSSPPSSGAANFPELALPGSPLHRCFSCARLLATGGRRRNHASNAPQRPPPPPLPLLPPRPDTMDSRPKYLTSRSRDVDVESAQPSSTTTVSGQPARPVAARGKRGAGEGCTARRPSAAAALEVLFAASVGSALDLDHFLAAGSVRLSRATALAGRPWGHCVAALIVAVRRNAEYQTRVLFLVSSCRGGGLLTPVCVIPPFLMAPLSFSAFCPIHTLAGK